MGNRAVISFGTKPSDIGIYLHWNGGPESVLAFLEAAKQLKVRNGNDEPYCIARLTQLIGNFFGGTLSLGVATLKALNCDNGDNGHYILNPGLTIAERRFTTDKALTVEGLAGGQRDNYEAILAEVLAKNTPTFDKE